MNIPSNFYSLVEQEAALDYILYGDTDSLFVHIPTIHPKTTKEAIKYAEEIAEKINTKIIYYLNNYMLPTMGVSPDYNFTDFKTELVIDSIVFLDVKKNYALRIIAKKGEVYDKPKISYTGLPIIKVGFTVYGQQLLKYIINEIILNKDIPKPKKLEECEKIIQEYKAKTKKACDEYDYKNIGRPAKMSDPKSKAHHVVAMRKWNEIVGQNDFQLWSSGYIVYTNIGELAIPFWKTEKENISILKQHGINFDFKEIWNKNIFIGTTKRALEVCAMYSDDVINKIKILKGQEY